MWRNNVSHAPPRDGERRLALGRREVAEPQPVPPHNRVGEVGQVVGEVAREGEDERVPLRANLRHRPSVVVRQDDTPRPGVGTSWEKGGERDRLEEVRPALHGRQSSSDRDRD